MLARRILLLADDSPTVQKVVSLTFSDEGMEVLTAAGGEEALARLGETVPDVLLADVHMPAPGGYELCARAKRDPRTARVPVLLLVGAFEPFDEAEARACGADGVLTKPFQSIRELVSKVGGLISGHPEQSKDAARDDAAAAHLEAPAPAAAAHQPPPAAAAEDVQPSPAFAGLDADDESIESVPADAYVAAARARDEDAAAEFVAADAPVAQAASGRVEEVIRVESAAGVAGASSFGAAAGMNGGGGHAASRFGVPQPDPGFVARAPQPAAEDSLLELGEAVSARSRGADDFDDLILDIGDDAEADATQAEVFEVASEADDVFGFADVEAEPAAAEISPANLSSAWSDAPLVEVPAAPPAFGEPPPDEVEAYESAEPELDLEAETAASAEAEVAAPASAVAVEAQDAPHAEASAPYRDASAFAATEVAGSRAEAADASSVGSQFSPELVEAVARRVVELISDRAVREIAWEVVPDLAERLIRERLEKEDARAS